MSLVTILGLVTFIAVSVYQKIFLIQADFATVTAPRVEMIGAEMGQVSTSIAGINHNVSRDELIYTMRSAALSSEQEKLATQVTFLRNTLSEVQTHTEGEQTSALDVNAAQRELSLITGELQAVEVRSSDLTT